MRRSSRPVAGALALLIALVTAGCGASPGDRAPLPGNVVTFAYDEQPECLDPQVSAKDVTGLVTRNMVDSLVSMDPDGRFHPWLAKRWKISQDGRVYTFRLRDDVVFHDGTRFDASAVVATLDHAVAPETKSQYAVALARGYEDTIAVNKTTVRIRLSQPNAAFLQALSTPYLGMQSPKALRAAKGGLCEGPVGSGPLRFVKWSRNHQVAMKRNDDYRWNPSSSRHRGPVSFDGLVIEFINEDASRFGALTSGQVDAAGNIPPSKAATLDVTDGMRLYSAQTPGAVFTVLFNTTHGPLRDERLRRALLLSVDMDRLVKAVFFGRYARAWSMLSPTTPFHSEKTKGTWRHGPREAARLLDAAGWTGRDSEGYRTKNGRRLTLSWPYAADLQSKADILGQGIQAEAKKVGIQLRWYPLDVGTYIKRTTAGRGLDMYSTSFVRAEPDILRFFFGSRETLAQGGGNVFHVDDPALDKMLDAGAETTDPARRASTYNRAQRYILDHALAMPVYVPTALVGTSDRIRGLTFDASSFPLFHDVVREEA